MQHANQLQKISLYLTFFLLILHVPYISFASADPKVGNLPYMQYNIIGSQAGLVGNRVLDIEQDSLGTIWIGTDKGIGRISENEVINYGRDSIFLNKRIRFITKDNEGQIWAATSWGLCKYDYSTDRFRLITSEGVPVIATASDVRDDGIYFICREGLIKIRYGSENPEIMLRKKDLPSRIRHFKMLDDSTGIAVSDTDGTYSVGLHSGHTRKILQFGANDFVKDVCLDMQGRLWIAFYNKGLICISPVTGEVYAEFDGKDSFLDGNIILSLNRHDGQIWVATDGGGIFTITPPRFNVANIQENLNSRLPEEAESASSLLIADDLWIGTVRHGVINLRPNGIRNFNKDDFGFPKSRGANRSIVSCLCEDSDGKIWAGTDGSGITVYDPEENRFKVADIMDTEKITSIEYIDDDEMLLSIYNKGIYKYNTRTGKTEYVPVVDMETTREILKQDMIINLERLDDNTIYVLANRIFIYDTRTGRITDPGIDDIVSGNNFWIADINRFRTICYDHFTIYSFNNSTRESRKLFYTGNGDINMVRAIGEDLWIIKGNSLSKLNFTTGEISDIPFPYNSRLLSMEPDLKGHLWLMASEKLIRLDLADPACYVTFDSADGYTPNSFLEGVAIRSHTGEIYAGGTGGLCVINTNKIDSVIPEYDISLLKTETSCRKIRYGTASADTLANIRLPWNYRTVRFRLCLSHGDVLKKNRFRYIIERPWQRDTLTSDCHFEFSNLLPGKYKVLVSYLDRADRWNENGKYILIRISYPWWIWPFIILIIYSMASIVSFYFRISRKERPEVGTENTKLDAMPLPESPDREFMDKIDRFIDDNISNDTLNAQMIINYMCMGRASFYKKFKDTSGVGIMEYIAGKRMKIASEMLKDKNIQMSEIALKVGYSDYPYFSRVFKQYYKMSPSAYRKHHLHTNSASPRK